MNQMNVSLPESVQQIDDLLDVRHQNWHFNWLAWICGQLPQARAALVVVDETASGQFEAKAVWPEDSSHDQLLQDAAEETLRQQQPLLTPLNEAGHHVGSYPLFIDGKLRAVTTL